MRNNKADADLTYGYSLNSLPIYTHISVEDNENKAEADLTYGCSLNSLPIYCIFPPQAIDAGSHGINRL